MENEWFEKFMLGLLGILLVGSIVIFIAFFDFI